jgi:hypothetical protein
MSIFATAWQASLADKKWRNNILLLDHKLPELPQFDLASLAKLIEILPRENYMLMHTGVVGTAQKLWEEGEIGALSGEAVIEAIKHGNLWLLIRKVEDVIPAYADLLHTIYAEIDSNVAGGYPTFNQISDILISSPSAQVYYHFDHNGQTLWQIHGPKRVYVYPNKPPFLTKQMLEYTALYADETSVPYDPSYDQSASVYDLKAGQMLHWPLFSPHRVENLEFSVSYTTQYYTSDIKRLARLHAGNGLIHTRFPGLDLRDDLHGPAYAAKSLLQSGVRRLGLIDTLRQSKRTINFKLDPRTLGQIVRV